MQLDYNAVYDAFGENVFEGLATCSRTRGARCWPGMSAAWAMYQTCGGHEDDEDPDPIEPLSASAGTLLNIMENY